MRNLKKVLSLVLCLAMMLSIMVVGAGAAFNDRDQIDDRYAEAAEVLTNLGVLKGYEDGSFKPQGDITRAEVAAVIYRVVTSDVNDKQASVYADYNKFSDVKTADWFAGYVNFCGNAELIKGYGDGKFGPQDNITGYQALAMILRAVGYDQNGEFTGPNWIINTASLAESLGILKNVEKETLGAPATRELVAELIFQAMNIPTVTYTNALNYSTTTGKKTNPTLGEREFDLSKQEGVVVANEAVNLNKAGTSLDDGKTALRQTVDKKTVDTTYNLSTDISIIGENVYVWVSGKDAVSTPVSLATVKDFSNTSKSTLENVAAGAQIYNNYVSTSSAAYGLGVMVKAIDNNDDGKYDIVLTEKNALAEVKYISTDGTIYLNQVTSAKEQVASGISVGDVVLTITYGGRTYIDKADYVTGNIASYVKTTKTDVDNTASINGTDYKVSGIDYSVVASSNVSPVTKQFTDVTKTFAKEYNGKTYNYYLDSYGNIIAYALAAQNETSYGLILAYDYNKTGAFAGEWSVRYLTVDNTVETKVVSDETSKVWPSDKGPGDVVKYRLNSADEFVAVYDVEDVSGTVTTYPDTMKATISSAVELSADTANEPSTTYNVTDDFVAFYYVDRGWGFEAVYGVLTGADAIADLEGGKNLVQCDTLGDIENTHTSLYDTLTVVNINDYINASEQYCYVFTDQLTATYSTDTGVVYTYAAVNAAGDPIEVVASRKLLGNDEPVWNYVTANVDYVTANGNIGNKVVNRLERVVETVGIGDLHADQTSSAVMYLYGYTANNGVIDPFTAKLDAPAVYADVTSTAGGTTSLSAQFCSAGYVVYDNDEALAVFVEKTVDNHPYYVDVKVEYDKDNVVPYHLLVGSTFPVPGYEGYTYDWTATNGAPGHGTIDSSELIKVEASMQDATVVLTAPPAPNTAIGKLASARLNTENLDVAQGYDKRADAVAHATKIDLPAATTSSYELTITTKPVSETNSTLVYGAVDHATSATAANALSFESFAPISGTAQAVNGISHGSYIVIALENFGDVAYYAYYIN